VASIAAVVGAGDVVSQAATVTPLETLLSALHDGGVQFIIVGGVAARAHGSSRVTDVLDIVYARDAANLARVVSALSKHKPYLRGAPPGLPFEWSVASLRAGLNFTLITDAGALDLFGEIAGGGGYSDLVHHSIAIHAFDRDLLLLDLPWLIRVKRAAGRPKDLEVIAELEALSEERDGLG
jgi:hypothetical protein